MSISRLDFPDEFVYSLPILGTYEQSYDETLENPPDEWQTEAGNIFNEVESTLSKTDGMKMQKMKEMCRAILSPEEAGRRNSIKQKALEEGYLEQNFPLVLEKYRIHEKSSF